MKTIEETAPRIEVLIGTPEDGATPWHVIYYAVCTSAPVDYDGFGTITLLPDYYFSDTGKECRLVLIEKDHLQWQTMRYRSGVHRVEAADDDLELEIRKRAVERFVKGGARE